MTLLAEIWIGKGKRDQARQLLLDALKATRTEAKEDDEIRDRFLPRLKQDFARLFSGETAA